MAKRKLRLFVWTDFCPDYTGGLAVVIAEDESQARKLITKGMSYEPYTWGDLSIYRLDQRRAFTVTGGG